jgi:murein DD-endopeptidase MepM/ murein hydrolase activator NlpD
VNLTPILYQSQSGDTLPAVAVRFGVAPEEIYTPDQSILPATSYLVPNTWLIIPNRLGNTTSSQQIMPDSEIIFSPAAVNFDVSDYVNQAGGYLSTYKEYLHSTGNTPGAEIIARVALDNSINPRLLLALLEYQSGWIFGQPSNLAEEDYPMGLLDLKERGLYNQLTWAINHLSIGYYGWREGMLTEITFTDGVTARLAPDLNAGTAAIDYFFSQLYDTQGWVAALDIQNGFPALYTLMFSDPWVRKLTVEPLYPAGLEQPPLILPFMVNQLWAFTGGPHGAWERDGSQAAIDFAPSSIENGCIPSYSWAVAAAPGLVVRSGHGVVVIDLDGDGYEQTGWALLYLHIATGGRIPVGTQVELADKIGHPSCEGGISTGTHIHMARKYNGEWIAADGPIPFNLSGWIAHAGDRPYQGTLTRDGDTIVSSFVSAYMSHITRQREEP